MDAPRDDRAYRAVNWVMARVFAMLGLRLELSGEDNLPASGGAVIACNHIGFLDFTFVGYAARSRGRLVRFVTKRSVFDVPLVGWLMRAMRHIPVDRRSGSAAYRQARRELDAGQLVGLFPEATISRSFMLKAFKPGAAGLALYRGAPLIPVIAWGGHRVLTVDGQRGWRRGKTVVVMVGEPLPVAVDDTVAAVNARLRDRMDVMLTEVLSAYPDVPRGGKDRWWLPHAHGGTAPDPATAERLDREALARIGEAL